MNDMHTIDLGRLYGDGDGQYCVPLAVCNELVTGHLYADDEGTHLGQMTAAEFACCFAPVQGPEVAEVQLRLCLAIERQLTTIAQARCTLQHVPID